MRPVGLKAGDILLYRSNGSWKSIGTWITWGQWRGTSQEALEYAHIALVFDETQACEMNPPCSRLMPLDGENWDLIDVYRIDVKGISPFDNATVLNAFHASVRSNLGERYNYGRIAGLLGLGLLARIGLGGVSRWVLSKNNPNSGSHCEICSTWAEDRLTDAIQSLDKDFDLFPDLGKDQASPADYPRSPWIKRIA